MRRPEFVTGTDALRRGFATAAVLGLVAVIALLSAAALHDALFGEHLATTRLLHQRASGLASIGIDDAMERISGQAAPGDLAFSLQPYPPSTDTVSVSIRHLGTAPLPGGASVGGFDMHQFEVESTGHTARGIHMTQVQGVTRVIPVAAPVTAEELP